MLYVECHICDAKPKETNIFFIHILFTDLGFTYEQLNAQKKFICIYKYKKLVMNIRKLGYNLCDYQEKM